MPIADLVVRGRRVVTRRGERPGALVVREGRIEALLAPDAALPAARLQVDAGELPVLPGLVDTHVHANEPGRTGWEGFATATDAAAAGGITTVVEMPLNASPPTTTPEALAVKVEALRGQARVDVGLWGGVVPGNRGALVPLLEAGVLGFKAFLVDSGVDDFPAVGEAELRAAMTVLAGAGAPLLAHAELPRPIEAARGPASALSPRRHEAWLASRPPEAEVEAVELLLRLCRETGCAVHVVHVSAAEALAPLAAARREHLPVSAETCPHYLTFAAAEIPEGATAFKCAPPIRAEANRERLWGALGDGLLDLVVSDHSPCPPELKEAGRGDFFEAWGGIASLELSASAIWTGAVRRGFGVEELVRWMAAAPARLAGLDRRKGALAPGWDGDVVVWDPDAEWTVEPTALRQRHPITPYAGRSLRGRARDVFVRGVPVLRDGELTPERPGRWLASEDEGECG